MIELIENSEEVKRLTIDDMVSLKNKLEIYYQPFADREIEELRKRYKNLSDVMKSKIKVMKSQNVKLINMKEKMNRLKITLSIVNILLFIVKQRFITPKVRQDITTILSNLKTMSIDQLIKQEAMLKETKNRILGGF